MSIAPLRGPVQRPGQERDIGELFQRVEDLERKPPGRWIYAGTYPGDPNTTPDSPAFVNGSNAPCTDCQPLRFRRENEWTLRIEGDLAGIAPGDVVVNLAALYRPEKTGRNVGIQGTSAVGWRLDVNGDLVYLGPLS